MCVFLCVFKDLYMLYCLLFIRNEDSDNNLSVIFGRLKPKKERVLPNHFPGPTPCTVKISRYYVAEG